MGTNTKIIGTRRPKGRAKMNYDHRDEVFRSIQTTPKALFAYLDDQVSLGSHMEKPSAMMLGGSMRYILDEGKGRRLGSVIRMEGAFLGIRLSVEEVVTEREPPVRKAWETRGIPHLLILVGYRMGFDVSPADRGQRLRVFIEYNTPRTLFGRIAGFLFAGLYARWCIGRMATEVAAHFGA
jgi:hypothetical protein